MRIEQLTTAMLEGEQSYDVSVPDLAGLHRLGTRRRRSRRVAGVAAAAAVVAALVAGALVGQGLVNRAEKPQPVKPDGTKVLSAFERRVLHDVPGSFAVRGEVLMPTPIDPDNPAWGASQVDGFVGRLAPLGWHAMLDLQDGIAYTPADYPAYLREPPPEDTQVIQDIGPMHLGCRPMPGARCGLFHVLTDKNGHWYTGDRLGDENFLKPGQPMQLRPGSTLENHRLQPTVVGGMAGTRTTRVVITLNTGRITDATVDRGHIAPGATVFWGLFDDAHPVRATAYDADGRMVEDHRLTPCDDPVDCQTR